MKNLTLFLALSLLIGSGYAQNSNKSEGISTPLFYATATQIWQTTLEDVTSAGTQLVTPTISGINSMELVNGMLYISRGISMSTGVFEKYDLNTESPTQIPISTGSLFQSLAWNPVNSTMYATTASPFEFGTVNLTTGVFTRISNLDRASRIAVDNDGIGFLQEASAGARFGTINLETGAFTHIADAQITMALIDLAVDRRTNILYSQALSTANTDVGFTTINKETGARTNIGNTSVRYRTFVFGFIEPTTVQYTVTITPGINGTITVKDGDDEVENGDEVEENTVLTLTAIPAEGYEFGEWWDGNIELTRVITLVSDTAISATFTAPSTSIVCEDATNRISAIVHPNPVTDILHIETENIIRQITVFDMQGRVVMTLYGDNKTVDLQMLPAGNFIVNIHTVTGVSPIRITKK
jgi:hypothetical protein